MRTVLLAVQRGNRRRAQLVVSSTPCLPCHKSWGCWAAGLLEAAARVRAPMLCSPLSQAAFGGGEETAGEAGTAGAGGRGSRAQDGCDLLAALEPELVLRIMHFAARPVSAWTSVAAPARGPPGLVLLGRRWRA